MKNKEQALNDYIEVIRHSWTYERMTKEEQNRLEELLHSNRTEKSLRGTHRQRCNIIASIYEAYLLGIGYTDFNWREEN